MLLRYRISILVTLAIVIACASIVFVGFKREELLTNQYSEELLADQLSLWHKINTELVQQMQDRKLLVSENRDLIRAIEAGDSFTIQSLGNALGQALKTEEGIDRFDLIYPDGTLAYSSLSSVFLSPIIASSTAQFHMDNDTEAKGIGNDDQRNTAVVYGFPLYSMSDSGEVIAMSVFATDILDAIAEMQRVTNSKVVFVNRRGRLLSSSEEALWEELRKSVNLSQLNLVQTIDTGQHHYSITVLPQTANLASLVGRLVLVKDISTLIARQKQISQQSAIIIGVLIVLLLVGLNFYMSRSFAPLTSGVKVLSALSQGNLYARLEHTFVDDEVGQISTAVNVFRTDLVALNRFRRSRERQRARQERFIFREMTELVEMLDGMERDKALSELEELRTKVRDTSTDIVQHEKFIVQSSTPDQHDPHRNPDSLALMAIAFQHMSNRIQDQHHCLREALRTKEALIAIRKELDIATRVQLSLLPNDLKISVSFHAAGAMSPAKEVGGDFFDFFRLDNDNVGVTIADVSGKGVPAAMFMIMARTLLRSTVFHIHSPAKVLEYMNNYLEQNNDEQLFITLFYGILNESDGTFTYATGGHNPPIVSNSKNTRTLDPTDGLVLGMISDIDYGETTTVIEPGSRIVMMTDGISEAFNQQGEAFGDDRTFETVRSLPQGQSPDDDVRCIIETVQDFVGTAPQFDDMTCIVLHYDL